jgi:hypothetical protein
LSATGRRDWRLDHTASSLDQHHSSASYSNSDADINSYSGAITGRSFTGSHRFARGVCVPVRDVCLSNAQPKLESLIFNRRSRRLPA